MGYNTTTETYYIIVKRKLEVTITDLLVLSTGMSKKQGIQLNHVT